MHSLTRGGPGTPLVAHLEGAACGRAERVDQVRREGAGRQGSSVSEQVGGVRVGSGEI